MHTRVVQKVLSFKQKKRPINETFDLGNEQVVCSMGPWNAAVIAQAEKGWYFLETSDTPTPSWWGLGHFEQSLYIYIYIYMYTYCLKIAS